MVAGQVVARMEVAGMAEADLEAVQIQMQVGTGLAIDTFQVAALLEASLNRNRDFRRCKPITGGCGRT